MHESKLHENNCFITLTYNESSIPGPSLVKSDFQKFIKRFRKAIAPEKIRYYMCGEYGETNHRPHYHACIFGYAFPDKRLYSRNSGSPLYTSKQLDELWGYGFATIGEVTFESAAYVARYVLKKVNGPGADDHYGDRIPEYTAMSRKPGIGRGWLDKFRSDVYPGDTLYLRGGIACRPPKYYDDQFSAEEPELMEVIKKKRKSNVRLPSLSELESRRIIATQKINERLVRKI